jgi:RNA-splicing ligase RtcB
MSQIREIIHHPVVSKSKTRFMPYCHRGKGCCVGFTSKLIEKIVPKFVGGDIGCGIITYSTYGIINEKYTSNLLMISSILILSKIFASFWWEI